MAMKREYPERPFVGVSAVVFYEQSVLLARRKQNPGRGQWSLPGGVVELGETLLEALRRELPSIVNSQSKALPYHIQKSLPVGPGPVNDHGLTFELV